MCDIYVYSVICVYCIIHVVLGLYVSSTLLAVLRRVCGACGSSVCVNINTFLGVAVFVKRGGCCARVEITLVRLL
jgi:hypothetical protein